MDKLGLIHSHRWDFGRRDLIRLTSIAAIAAAAPTAPFAQAGKLKIATIGAGREGGALGTQFAKAGHPVMEVGCGTCNGCSPARSSA